MTLAMEQLNTPANKENIAAIWDGVLEPLLAEQQRIMVTKNETPCTNEELKGFTLAYRALEKFAEEGKKLIAKREQDNNK